jgi:hypothetical protein
MSVSGVNNPLLSNLGTVARPGAAGASGVRPGQAGATNTGAVRPGVARPATTPASPALKPQASLATPASSLPVEAPPGTDPELWSVLTTEERTFFAKAAAMGPLTYGRIAAGIGNMSQATPVARGVRLDVRA